MEDWQRTFLDNNLLEITKSLDIRDTILGLRARNILNEDDEQLILNDSVHKIDSEKRQKIVDILKTRGKRAYWAFCHIVRNKTPFIYECLHRCEDENEKIEDVCLDCKGEENLSNCCNCCAGLVNALKTPELGVFVEKPEEVIEVFQKTKKEKENLLSEVEKQKAENEKLCQQNQKLSEIQRHLEQDNLLKGKKLIDAETEIATTNIEKEKAYVSLGALKKQILEVNPNQKVIAEAESSPLESEPIYTNSSIVDLIKNEQLDFDSGSETSLEHCDSNASMYKMKYETLEEVVKRQKKEHDKFFTVIQNNYKQLKDELKIHKDTNKALDNEKSEVQKEKEHLLKKLYSKEKMYMEAKQEKARLEARLGELEKQNEEMLLKIDELIKENESLKKSVDDKIATENDENNNKFCRPTDRITVLKKIDGIFGINYSVRKDLPLFGESRILVKAISPNNSVNESSTECVKPGDFVISINDENVQEADMALVRLIALKNSDYMKIVTRKPSKRVTTLTNVVLYHRNFDDPRELGLRIAPYVSMSSNSALRGCGLQEMDELVKINNKNLDNLTINEIYSKLIKKIQQNQCDITINRLLFKTSSELNLKKDLDILATPSPEHRKFTSASSEGSSSLQESPMVPRLPPRGVTSLEDLTSIDHNVAHQYTENYGTYQRVVTKEYDKGGTLVKDTSNKGSNYENKTIQIEIEKESYETFGLHMAGGNKSGIFVEAVDNWKAAQKSNIQVGWKILQINGLSLEKVAFCYAHEVLQKFSSHTRVVFLFEQTPMEYYKRIMKKRPYDAFHVEALVNYNGRDERELSFSIGDILCVDDSYFIEDPNQPYKWHATKNNGTNIDTGLIPRQIGNRAPSTIKEHHYEEIDAPSPTEKQSKGLFATFKKSKVSQTRLYKILEPVGEVLV